MSVGGGLGCLQQFYIQKGSHRALTVAMQYLHLKRLCYYSNRLLVTSSWQNVLLEYNVFLLSTDCRECVNIYWVDLTLKSCIFSLKL